MAFFYRVDVGFAGIYAKTAFYALAFIEKKLGAYVLCFGVMAPFTAERASFKENTRSYSVAVSNREALYLGYK